MPITGPLPAGSGWHSLRWRLPLTISLVMTTILAVVIVVAYREFETATAEEAETTHLEYAGSIRLLITDVVLPGSSGPDLFQRLSIRDSQLKVLHMSGYTDDAVFRTGRLQHGVAFVQKPFTADALRRKTREVLDA